MKPCLELESLKLESYYNLRTNCCITHSPPFKNNAFTWYSDSLRAGRSGNRIPLWGEIFRTRPYLPWDPPASCAMRYRVSCAREKRPGGSIEHPPSPSAEVKERVELYLYFPSGPSWFVLE